MNRTRPWIAIAMIALAVLGAVVGWALSAHNSRLSSIASATTNIEQRLAEPQAQLAQGQGRLEGQLGAISERLNGFDRRFDRIETSLDRLLRLHPPGASRLHAGQVEGDVDDVDGRATLAG